MAQRIVQLLVTMAVDTDRTRAEVRDEAAGALAVVADEVLVELVGSGQRTGGRDPGSRRGDQNA